MAPHDVHPELFEIFAPIARDLKAAGFRAKLRPERRVSRTDMWIAAFYVDGVQLGILGADPEASRDNQVWLMADQAQDLVLEFVRRGDESVVWPRCQPGHNHPMVVDRWFLPHWVCPKAPGYRVPIGGDPSRSPG